MRRFTAKALVARGAALLNLERVEDAIAAFLQTAEYIWTTDPAEIRHAAVR